MTKNTSYGSMIFIFKYLRTNSVEFTAVVHKGLTGVYEVLVLSLLNYLTL